MRVAELMHTNLRTVDPDATIADAVLVLADGHVSGLPVVDGRRRLLGVISASDVVTAIAEAETPQDRERLFEATRVREIMTSRAQVVTVETDVAEAARTMLYLEVHRLFVIEGGELVGVISQSDISGAVATANI
jgi:CBS domain-containing membrane protein